MSLKSLHAIVLSHLPFEDIGSLEPELVNRGFTISTIDVPMADFPLPQLQSADLLIVMGGPIGVYESDDYPFITPEIEAIRERLAARKPTLGICLGAQLMAAALAAQVYPGTQGPEIGWFPLLPPSGSQAPEWFAPLLAGSLPVLHWHGDTFDLPRGAKLLASTKSYPNQAFTIANFALALQFHPEVTEQGLERWYVGHTCELRAKKIDIKQLRQDARTHAPVLEKAAAEFWRLWLDHVLAHIL